jgi:hypothetical protein
MDFGQILKFLFFCKENIEISKKCKTTFKTTQRAKFARFDSSVTFYVGFRSCMLKIILLLQLEFEN